MHLGTRQFLLGFQGRNPCCISCGQEGSWRKRSAHGVESLAIEKAALAFGMTFPYVNIDEPVHTTRREHREITKPDENEPFERRRF